MNAEQATRDATSVLGGSSTIETAYGDTLNYALTEREVKVFEGALDADADKSKTLTPAVIWTDGRQLRPALKLLGGIVDECKMQIAHGGLFTSAVDPANVAMFGDFKLHAGGLRDYWFGGTDVENEREIGVPVRKLNARLRHARYGKSSKDPVRIVIGAYKMIVTTTRTYETPDGEITVPLSDEVPLVDPASVRQKPDVPDLSLPWQARVPPQAVADLITHWSNHYKDRKHVDIAERDGDLVISALGNLAEGEAVFEGAADGMGGEPGASSLFSTDYLQDVFPALASAYVDECVITWGSEYPAEVSFQRDQELPDGRNEPLYSGRYMQAPRIQSD